MAKLNFAQRFRTDMAFKAAVENIHLEAVLESAGIDPEDLNEAWEGGVRPLSLSVFRSLKAPKKTEPKAQDETPKPAPKKKAAKKASE